MTLKLKVGRKGYIILPKAVRDAVGIDEGDEVTVEVRDGTVLKPVKKVNVEELRTALRRHLNSIRGIQSLMEPKPGDLAETYLEEEFER